jgi:hypothetical protein
VSAYIGHPAVTADTSGGFTVTKDGTEYRVLDSDVFGWTICTGPNLDFVPTEQGGFAIGFPEADDAIRALIGDPA